MDASADATLDGTRGDRFRGQMLLLRGRAGLTQRALAALLGVSEKAVQKWEAGEGYPSAARLQVLIALYVARHVFTAGREAAEARALWDLLRREATQRTPPFDEAWFATVHPAGAAPPGPVAEAAAQPERPAGPRQDWGEAPEVRALQGRRAELQTLERWLREERCRVVALLGLGGIGKTTLAARLAQDLAPHFAGLCWRSLRNAPPPEEWLGAAIAALAPVPPVLPPGLPARLTLLLAVLRERRCLLVLDNLETVLEPGERAARYRAGYEGYGALLRTLGEASHQSLLLLTSREQPPELAPLAGEQAAVRALRLSGLPAEECQVLLQDRGLSGERTSWGALVGHYGGNPLALKVVGQTIAELFRGQIAAFLTYATETSGAVFGGVRQLLEEQVTRLSPLEQSVLYWLAVEREPVGVAALAADLGPGAGPGSAVLEAVTGLERRSLLERGGRAGTHTLQPVVLEHATDRLVQAVAEEIVHGQPALLVSHALVKATARDYVLRSQEQLIALPLLERLHATRGSAAVEGRLLALLDRWRGRPDGEQGYGPGNVVNLLRLLRGDLRGLDLSRLAIRHAYLQGVEAQDASLAGARLDEAVLDEAFAYPTALALSADGAFLAAGTPAGEVRLWRAADRTLLLAVQGHTGAVRSVALSGDGRLLASGGVDATVKLWATGDGRLLTTLHGHTGAVWAVGLSGDGRLVASGSVDGTVKLWEPSSGQLLATLHEHTGAVWGLALSADGRLVASGSFDGTVKVWEAASGRPLATLQGHAGLVYGVALSADGRLVASGNQDGTVKVWEAASGQLLTTLRGHMGLVYGVALSADGRLVASGSFDGTVKVWEAASGQLLATLQGHTGLVYSVALSGDGRLVASSNQDGTVKVWEVGSGQLLTTLRGNSGVVWAVALSEDGRLVASGSEDGTVKLWAAGSGQLLTTLEGHPSLVHALALSEDGRFLASGSWDGTVKLWAVGSRRSPATLQEHRGVVWAVALSGDGRLVASGNQDGTVTLWEVKSGQLLATLQGHTELVRGVALSRDGHWVASGSTDGTVRLWAAGRGRLLTTLQGHTGGVYGVALSGDGQLVASGNQDGTVKVWEARSGQLLATLQGHGGVVWAVGLSGDGRLVASGSWDGSVRLWEAGTGQLLATLQGHTGLIRSVALSGDGALVASGSEDGTVKLWAAHSGACLRVLRADRHYERLNIANLTGITEAQRTALLALGAVDSST